MGVSRHPLFAEHGRLEELPADRRTLRPLQQSLLRALSQGDRLLEHFYALLFERGPELRSLFPADLADLTALRCKLRASLALLFSPVTDPGTVAAELARLARLHDARGIRAEHYALAAECLVESLATFDAAAWTSELEHEWTQALHALGFTLVAAAPSMPS